MVGWLVLCSESKQTILKNIFKTFLFSKCIAGEAERNVLRTCIPNRIYIISVHLVIAISFIVKLRGISGF